MGKTKNKSCSQAFGVLDCLYPMKQSKPIVKRKRRKAYLKRKKALLKSRIKVRTSAKKAAKK